MTGGIGLLMGQAWGSPVVMGSAAFSTVSFILFWDGEMQKLADKGGIGILINMAILVVVLRWPSSL